MYTANTSIDAIAACKAISVLVNHNAWPADTPVDVAGIINALHSFGDEIDFYKQALQTLQEIALSFRTRMIQLKRREGEDAQQLLQKSQSEQLNSSGNHAISSGSAETSSSLYQLMQTFSISVLGPVLKTLGQYYSNSSSSNTSSDGGEGGGLFELTFVYLSTLIMVLDQRQLNSSTVHPAEFIISSLFYQCTKVIKEVTSTSSSSSSSSSSSRKLILETCAKYATKWYSEFPQCREVLVATLKKQGVVQALYQVSSSSSSSQQQTYPLLKSFLEAIIKDVPPPPSQQQQQLAPNTASSGSNAATAAASTGLVAPIEGALLKGKVGPAAATTSTSTTTTTTTTSTSNAVFSTSSSSTKRTRKTFKVLLVGDGKVGKTAFVNRLVNRDQSQLELSSVYTPSVGAQVTPISLVVPEGGGGGDDDDENENDTEYVFNIWDCAGKEKNSGLNSGYYIGAHVVILMFDLTNDASYDHLEKWRRSVLDVVDKTKVKFVLVGNIAEVGQRPKHMQYESINFHLSNHEIPMSYFEVSARSTRKCDKIIEHLGALVQ